MSLERPNNFYEAPSTDFEFQATSYIHAIFQLRQLPAAERLVSKIVADIQTNLAAKGRPTMAHQGRYECLKKIERQI